MCHLWANPKISSMEREKSYDYDDDEPEALARARPDNK
jgi:hypothetical protein